MNDIVIIAASNRPDMIDSSLLRPGRFDRLIYVKVPDTKGRYEIMKVHTKKVPIDYDNVDYSQYSYALDSVDIKDSQDFNATRMAADNAMPSSSTKEELDGKIPKEQISSNRDKFMMIIAKKTEGFSGADIESLVKEAAILALRKSIDANNTNGKEIRVTMSDFEEALNKVKPSITKEIEEAYQQMESKLRLAKGEEVKPVYYG